MSARNNNLSEAENGTGTCGIETQQLLQMTGHLYFFDFMSSAFQHFLRI